MTVDMNWTPERVKLLRGRFRCSQAQVAECVGVGKAMWCHWEKGRYAPTKPFCILLKLLEDGRIDGPAPAAIIPVLSH